MHDANGLMHAWPYSDDRIHPSPTQEPSKHRCSTLRLTQHYPILQGESHSFACIDLYGSQPTREYEFQGNYSAIMPPSHHTIECEMTVLSRPTATNKVRHPTMASKCLWHWQHIAYFWTGAVCSGRGRRPLAEGDESETRPRGLGLPPKARNIDDRKVRRSFETR